MEPVTEVTDCKKRIEEQPKAPMKVQLPKDQSLGSLLEWFTMAEEASKSRN